MLPWPSAVACHAGVLSAGSSCARSPTSCPCPPTLPTPPAPQLGSVHFLILDSETDSSQGSQQHAFAAADLARVDRRKTPWVIVG